ncbi:MAG: hypothetical protein R3E79_05260 [Caldilineaceae bacterium]
MHELALNQMIRVSVGYLLHCIMRQVGHAVNYPQLENFLDEERPEDNSEQWSVGE